jgi:hypothetical protein
MSAAITAAHAANTGRPLGFSTLEKRIAEGKLSPAQAQEEDQRLATLNAGQATSIGGTPASPGAVVGETPAQHKRLIEELTLQPGAPGSPAGGVVEAGETPVVEGIVHEVEPIAKKVTLYFVFIVGSVALMVYGVSKMLEPVGGPNLKSHIKGAVEKAGAAAVLA